MSADQQKFYELLQGVKQGSQDAARRFLEEYGKHIRRVVRRNLLHKLRTKFDSDDFLQEVCVSFFSRPPSPEDFPNPPALLEFLANLARNKVTDTLRRRFAKRRSVNRENSMNGPVKEEVDNKKSAEADPSDVVAVEESWEALGRGSEQRRKLVYLLRNGYTQEEIARVLDISVRHVRRLLTSVRAKYSEE